MGDCENILGDWGWLGVIGGDWGRLRVIARFSKARLRFANQTLNPLKKCKQ